MKKAIRPLVIANWKMNPQTVSVAKRLASDIKKDLARIDSVEVVLAPPAPFLSVVEEVRNGSKKFKLGAQNVHWEKLGAKTGEVSVLMLAGFGVSHVIVGHSERRAAGETNTEVNKKVRAVLKAGMTAVVCVGENKRDHAGHYLNVVEGQVREACAGLPKAKLSDLVIAYEPVWAISEGDGKGQTATPGDAYEMKLFIRKVLSDIYGRNDAERVRVLYGGSVNGKNAESLTKEGMVDGFLVGGASLRAPEFIQIIKACL